MFDIDYRERSALPLRLPTATERLDPPLVDILVRGARRVREVNEAEGYFLVQLRKQKPSGIVPIR